MKVLKFGGTSVGSPEIISQVIDIVKNAASREKVVMVVSAFGGVTDQLVGISKQAAVGDETYLDTYKALETRHYEAIKQLVHARKQGGVIAGTKYLFNELGDILHGVFLVKELSPKMQDFILSFGERLSAHIVTEAFREREVDAECVDARNLILTDRHFGNANVNFRETNLRIREFFARTESALQVVPGFVASTPEKETSTLGRGGSDYTASILAAALDADTLEIWTDVSGMMTADPKKVEEAFTIPEISYEEGMELSYFGAKVIYPPSIQPAYEKKIPIHIKNTFRPSDAGTIISNRAKDDQRPIRGISSMKDIALVTLSGSGMIGVTGTSMRLFTALARQKINVILISQASSEHSITIAVKQEEAGLASEVIREAFSPEIESRRIERIEVEYGLSVVAIVGRNMKNTPGISGKLFSSLGKNGVNVLAIAQGASELNISFVARKEDEFKALNALHEAFFLSDTKVVHLFVAGGTGLIGRTLLRQIARQADWLKQNNAIDIRLNGLVNTKKMLIEKEGIPISTYEKSLEEAQKPGNIDKFVRDMIGANLPNSIFVDATASQAVADRYKDVLDASISIVTPNKLACSGDYGYYRRLKETAQNRNIKFLFETNVGAGLPVIGTLNDLLHSGDKVLRVEAILSGTLNYIFNNVSQAHTLSEVVRKAMDEGLTEPDPRIDLSGSDVARKILILAREMGIRMSLPEVALEPIVPKEYLEAPDVESFFKGLAAYDAAFEEKRGKLDADQLKFRVIATLENGHAAVKLETFGPDHPFYTAAGSDNIILFTTDRYRHQPLMIKGPGAGAEVTAAGVFADIIRIAN